MECILELKSLATSGSRIHSTHEEHMDASLRLEALYSRQNSVIESCWTFKLGYFVHAQRAITVEQCKIVQSQTKQCCAMRQSQPHLTCSTAYTERMPTEMALPSDQSLQCPPSIPFRYSAGSWQMRSPMLLLAAMAPWSSVYAHSERL